MGETGVFCFLFLSLAISRLSPAARGEGTPLMSMKGAARVAAGGSPALLLANPILGMLEKRLPGVKIGIFLLNVI